MNNEIKEILEALRDSIDNTGTDKVNFINWVDKIENCITTLQKKYNKALELLVDFDLPCEYDEFNIIGGIDYCEKYCCVDDEQFKECWNKFIEWKSKDNER